MARVGIQRDLHTTGLVRHRRGVNVVPAVLTRGTGPKRGRAAIVANGAIAADAKIARRDGAGIALKLRRRRRKNAATA